MGAAANGVCESLPQPGAVTSDYPSKGINVLIAVVSRKRSIIAGRAETPWWALANIPVEIRGVPSEIRPGNPPDAPGLGSSMQRGYDGADGYEGPCPVIAGRNDFIIGVYAMDRADVVFSEFETRDSLEKLLKNHAIAEAKVTVSITLD